MRMGAFCDMALGSDRPTEQQALSTTAVPWEVGDAEPWITHNEIKSIFAINPLFAIIQIQPVIGKNKSSKESVRSNIKITNLMIL